MRIKLKRKEAIAGLEGIASLPAVLVVKVSTPPGGLNPGLKANTLRSRFVSLGVFVAGVVCNTVLMQYHVNALDE